MEENKNEDGYINRWRRTGRAVSIFYIFFLCPYVVIFILILIFNPDLISSRKMFWQLLWILVSGSGFLFYFITLHYLTYFEKHGVAPSNKLIYRVIDKLDTLLNGSNKKKFGKFAIISIVITILGIFSRLLKQLFYS